MRCVEGGGRGEKTLKVVGFRMHMGALKTCAAIKFWIKLKLEVRMREFEFMTVVIRID